MKKNNIYTVETIVEKAKLTNLERVEFTSATETAGVVRSAAATIAKDHSVLWSFDCKSCTMKEKKFNADLAYSVPATLRDSVRAFWYRMQLKDIDAFWAKYADINPADFTPKSKASADLKKQLAAAKIYYDTAKARVDNAREALKDFETVRASGTVELIVLALRYAKKEDYPTFIKTTFDGVEKELKALNECEIPADSDITPNLKKLREALQPMCNELWTKDEARGVLEYRFNCNAGLALDIYRLAYTGRKENEEGKQVKTYAADKTLISEVVRACIELLQKKYSAGEEAAAK